jgi:hypothetical protein
VLEGEAEADRVWDAAAAGNLTGRIAQPTRRLHAGFEVVSLKTIPVLADEMNTDNCG